MWKVVLVFLQNFVFVYSQTEATGVHVTSTESNDFLFTDNAGSNNSSTVVLTLTTQLLQSTTTMLQSTSSTMQNTTSVQPKSSSLTTSTNMHYSTHSPNVTKTIRPSSTRMPSSSVKPTQTVLPSSSHRNQTSSKDHSPTSIRPSSVSTQHLMSSTVTSTTTPKPDVVYECGEECKSLRKKLYAAASFAILFVIVALVLSILLYRQYQITRDYRDDPTLSRLI